MEILYGKAKSGKTEYMFKKICSLLSNGHKCVITVPEMQSFRYEKALCGLNVKKADFEVTTFSKIAKKMYLLSNFASQPLLSESGRALLMQKAIFRKKSALLSYGASADKIGIADAFGELYHELASMNIDINFLFESAKDNTRLYEKISDFREVFSQYEEYAAGKTDSDKIGFTAAEMIEKENPYSNCHMFFDGFSDFGEAHYKIIDALRKTCPDMTFAVCADKNFENSWFLPSAGTIKRLCAMDKNVRLTYIDHTQKTGGLYHIQNSFTKPNPPVWEHKTENIYVSESANPYLECEEAALFVRELVKKRGFRYKDIAVAAGDKEEYFDILSRTFKRFGIPLYVSKQKSAASAGASPAVLSALFAAAAGMTYDRMFSYLKSEYSDITADEADRLENYCLAAGIGPAHWAREEKWQYKTRVFSDNGEKDDTDEIDIIRRRGASPIIRLSESIGKNSTISESVRALYMFIKQTKIDEKTKKLSDKLGMIGDEESKNEIIGAYNAIIDVISEMDELIGTERIGRERFVRLFAASLSARKLRGVPARMDEVVACDVASARETKCRALLALGTNTGGFLGFSGGEGLLSDSDRMALSSLGAHLLSTARKKVFDHKYSIYKCICAPSEILYVSRALNTVEGKSAGASLVISKLKKMFKELNYFEGDKTSEKPSALLEVAKKSSSGEALTEKEEAVMSYFASENPRAAKIINYAKRPLKTAAALSDSQVARLMGENPKMSITRLETYAKCPFSYFASYMLSARERRIYTVGAPEIGDMVHKALEYFVDGAKNDNIRFSDMTDDYIEKNTEKVALAVADKMLFGAANVSKANIYFTKRLKKNLSLCIKIIAEHIRAGRYEPVGSEVRFDDGGEIECVTVDLTNGRKMKIHGIIDRVDKFCENGQTYWRVVDYKTGSKSFSLSSIALGLDFQLALYSDAVTNGLKNGKCGAMMYFKISEKIEKSSSPLSDEEARKKLSDSMKMDGMALSDEAALLGMDKNLFIDSKSSVFNCRLNGDGSLSKTSAVGSEELLCAVIRRVRGAIREIGENIFSGKIDISPCYSSKINPCSYCKFSAICQNVGEGKHRRELEEIKDPKQAICDRAGQDKGGE